MPAIPEPMGLPVTKAQVKAAISILWQVGGLCRRRLLAALGRHVDGRLVVLYYHGVSSDASAGFARQMHALARTATVVRADHQVPLPAGARCAAVTFDDAFRSVLEHAVPELLRQGFPATVFVPTAHIGRRPGWEAETGLASEEAVMSAEELRGLPDSIELGSHTALHSHLLRLDDEQLHEELAGSKASLTGLIGRPVTLLAFPYGEYDERVVRACRSAGYERVFTIEPRPADSQARDFVRGRVSVEPTDGPIVFQLKASGAYAWMTHASALKARIRNLGQRS